VLLGLLAVECATAFRIHQFLPAHYFFGLLLVPPVLLKLGSTGWRFVSYYVLRDPAYRQAGTPPPSLRLLAPVVIVATVLLVGSGVELWLFGFRFGAVWLTIHEDSFLVWFFATGAHALSHLDATRRLTAADLAGGPGAITRRSLLTATLLVGLLLALVSLPWWSPFGLLES
jgi:hypothetical protein